MFNDCHHLRHDTKLYVQCFGAKQPQIEILVRQNELLIYSSTSTNRWTELIRPKTSRIQCRKTNISITA